MTKLSTWINGGTGKMGQVLRRSMDSNDRFQIVGYAGDTGHYGADNKSLSPKRADELFMAAKCFIDFSLPKANSELLDKLETKSGPSFTLIATTGLSNKLITRWQAYAEKNEEAAVLIARNTSVGVLASRILTAQLAKILLPLGYDCEIIESHHKHKVDAPSGTALMLAEAAAMNTDKLINSPPKTGKRNPQSINIHAVRGGGIFGEHQVRFISEHDEIALSHRAFSRELFSTGAIALTTWLSQQKSGFYLAENIDLTELC